MDLIREEPKERVYEREAVLGRDAGSVFPTEIARAAREGLAAAAESIGGRSFITQSELDAIKADQGGTTAEPVIPDKPLAQILADAKAAKEEAFQEQWKQMKTGKNRPLDEDELQFLDTLQQQAAAADAAWRAEQSQELDAYQQAVKERAERAAAAAERAGREASVPQLTPKPSQPRKVEQKAKPQQRRAPLVHIVRKAPSSAAAAAQPSGSTATASPSQPADGPPAKRQHVDSGGGGTGAGGGGSSASADRAAGDGDGSNEGGLAGLLGGYGSSSDSG